jgi:hypothetical protein
MGKSSGREKWLGELGAQIRRKRIQQERAQKGKKPQEPANDPGVNEFAAKHGDYERNLRHVVNAGGTPVARWKKAGLLSDTQQAAILHMIRLWELTDASPRLVANLDRTVFGCPGNGNMAEIEARDDLKRITGYFPMPLDKYFQIFENVCRFDEPAGVAGSRLANNKRSAMDAARNCVCFVADTIYCKERLSY